MTRRPEGRTAIMVQRWEHLLFLHWSVDPEIIQATLPPGLWVDTYDDRAWLAIVPFYMRGLRPRFCPPVPGLSNFLELNLRTYVHDRHGNPGVWFYSLDANQQIAVKIARTFFSLPYVHANIASSIQTDQTIDFQCARPGHDIQTYQYRPTDSIGNAAPASLEFFLVERYLLFSYHQKRKQLYRGRIHHAPYPLMAHEVTSYSRQLLPMNGFADPDRPPDHIIGSPKVDVTVFGLEPVPD